MVRWKWIIHVGPVRFTPLFWYVDSSLKEAGGRKMKLKVTVVLKVKAGEKGKPPRGHFAFLDGEGLCIHETAPFDLEPEHNACIGPVEVNASLEAEFCLEKAGLPGFLPPAVAAGLEAAAKKKAAEAEPKKP